MLLMILMLIIIKTVRLVYLFTGMLNIRISSYL